MKVFLNKILSLAKAHKLISLVVILILAYSGYYLEQKLFPTVVQVRYLTSKVSKDTIVSTISGTGQVVVFEQVDLKTKAAGEVIFLGVSQGQQVKAGTVLLQLDASDAYKTVRDAQANLDSAKLSLEKMTQPAGSLSILQAQNILVQAQQSKQSAGDALNKAYDDGFNAVSNVFLNLPSLMDGLHGMLYGSDLSNNTSNIDWYFNQGTSYDANNSKYTQLNNYRDEINASYALASASYNTNFEHYKNISRSSSTSSVEGLITESYNTTKLIADVVKNASNFIDFVKNLMENSSRNVTIPTLVTTHQASLNTYTGQTNTNLTNLFSIEKTINDSKNSIIDADRTIEEKTISLANLEAGADPLDIKAQQISVQQRVNTLLDGQQKLADYTVRAPFDGVIAVLSVKKGDQLSSGAAVCTFITQQNVVNITLNEVDMAKVKIGQKVSLTFDAIADLEITGEVAQIDTIGTVTQGVVNYGVKIGLDVPDERIKPGMSVSASIITNVAQDVLSVPSSAIKTSGTGSYVEVLDPTQINSADSSTAQVVSKVLPTRKVVEVGITNDTETEIVSGLSEGDLVVTQTINGTAKTTTAATTGSSALRIPGITGGGGGGGGGGGFRPGN